ncbi:hypothetical protein D3C87_1759050 [compost metagenome]
MFANNVGGWRLVDAIDLVAGDMADDPCVGHAKICNDRVGFRRQRAEVVLTKLVGSGYFTLYDEGGHRSVPQLLDDHI